MFWNVFQKILDGCQNLSNLGMVPWFNPGSTHLKLHDGWIGRRPVQGHHSQRPIRRRRRIPKGHIARRRPEQHAAHVAVALGLGQGRQPRGDVRRRGEGAGGEKADAPIGIRFLGEIQVNSRWNPGEKCVETASQNWKERFPKGKNYVELPVSCWFLNYISAANLSNVQAPLGIFRGELVHQSNHVNVSTSLTNPLTPFPSWT